VGKLTIGIGPEIDTPSWRWVGFDTARELSKFYSVEIFREAIPECDLAIVIKTPVELRIRTPVVYLPLDYYSSVAELHANDQFLRSCSAIGCHSECLMPFFRRYCDDVFFVQHHGRFSLAQVSDYKEGGYILWIGGLQYVPYLLKWLILNPIEDEIRILTDVANELALESAKALANILDLEFNFSRSNICGHAAFRWTERAQYNMMREAKAALDVKGTSFAVGYNWPQYMKPPTKAQQFISSGIPFAVNPECYSYDYFQRRGFQIASPAERSRWLSFDYWKDTARYAVELRSEISLERVCQTYREVIQRKL
jgi:hypothetical protein